MDERNDLGRPFGDPALGLELADDGGRHRARCRRLRGGSRHGLTCPRERRNPRPSSRVRARQLGARAAHAGPAPVGLGPTTRATSSAVPRLPCGSRCRRPSSRRELRLAVGDRRLRGRRAHRLRQLPRGPRRALVLRACDRPRDLHPGQSHAARRPHVPRAAHVRAREPCSDARGRASAPRTSADRAPRGRADLGGAVRAARRRVLRAPRGGEDAVTGRRVGVDDARAHERHGADRVDLRQAGSQPAASGREVPRADRAHAEDRREDPPLRESRRAPDAGRRPSRRARVRVRLLRPGAPEPRLPGVRREAAVRVRPPDRSRTAA